jgi:hypothetical protein
MVTKTFGISMLVLQLIFPALAVHLWLPLLGVTLLILKILKYLTKPLNFMKWFLKQGNDHPFEAIGIVAAVVVSAVTL